ncbi:MAG: EboA domain-containing protein [Alphaproteobacteria bacterium]|nr:EboA domain-containing protein [Alphaproteobacteria bacterium]MBT4084692.1 EboA domain-containing protein [Alphaproteobacteria bacterium]MBT4544648.1 EboA domain-containing protein [Alphaproteobacteria bacterium]MBT5920328.1 EboA domain-containing protein [Alphaproteobacteria bacterium]MBT7744938.1 EboA domain-containing protein [Alphaproteobacteria bacterium]
MSNTTRPLELMQAWLQKQLSDEAFQWLADSAAALAGAADRDLYLAVSLVPRKVGKADLILSEADMKAADEARSGWRPMGWSVDQTARLVIMLAATPEGPEFARRLEQLCITADVRESIAFYQGLPLYPEGERYVARAGEGLRTNMKAVFEAVAHDNPYPVENFGENAWNQMVLKAIFIGSKLDPIQGLDSRRNRDLATTLIDYAHERQAASRTIMPELWRMVGPFADDELIDELSWPLGRELMVERQAAALALFDSPHEKAAEMLNSVPEIKSDIEAGRVSWETVCNDAPKP